MKLSSERQMRMPGGARSRPLMTVEPVVVTPETDSNTASVSDMSSDEIAKGTAPAIAMVSHNRLTSRKPKRGLTGGGVPRVANATAMAAPPTTSVEKAKTCQSGWP